MKVRVKFFAYFRELFQGKEQEIELNKGTTVGQLLNLLCQSVECRKEIFDNSKLKPAVVVMKNGTHIHNLNGLETQIDDSDTIAIFPLMGGG